MPRSSGRKRLRVKMALVTRSAMVDLVRKAEELSRVKDGARSLVRLFQKSFGMPDATGVYVYSFLRRHGKLVTDTDSIVLPAGLQSVASTGSFLTPRQRRRWTHEEREALMATIAEGHASPTTFLAALVANGGPSISGRCAYNCWCRLPAEFRADHAVPARLSIEPAAAPAAVDTDSIREDLQDKGVSEESISDFAAELEEPAGHSQLLSSQADMDSFFELLGYLRGEGCSGWR